jgi:hypothetical protein
VLVFAGDRIYILSSDTFNKHSSFEEMMLSLGCCVQSVLSLGGRICRGEKNIAHLFVPPEMDAKLKKQSPSGCQASTVPYILILLHLFVVWDL